MIPLSTTKLQSGDFCFIPRSDGKFVPFVFLCARKGERSSFYGGILDIVVEKPYIEEFPSSLIVKEFALVHISCFKKNNTPIVGNVASRIGVQALDAIERKANDFSIGATSKVWGHLTIVKYAENINL